jgi:D-tyrosyl-tRNA(Tyr) deacylase
MAPKYAVNDLTLDVVKQMISRTTGSVFRAIVDWKGLNAENKAHIFPILEEAGLEIVRDKDA